MDKRLALNTHHLSAQTIRTPKAPNVFPPKEIKNKNINQYILYKISTSAICFCISLHNLSFTMLIWPCQSGGGGGGGGEEWGKLGALKNLPCNGL